MKLKRFFAQSLAGISVVTMAACGNFGSDSIGSGSIGSGNIFGGNRTESRAPATTPEEAEEQAQSQSQAEEARAERNASINPQRLDARERINEDSRGTVWDLFGNRDDPNTTLEVNKYIWNASLDVLNFLPIEAADPFSGVIVTGYGRPPGGGAAYRATVYVTDPALDARSLNLAMTRQGGGAVDADTIRAVEDAILTRARQLRIRDGGL